MDDSQPKKIQLNIPLAPGYEDSSLTAHVDVKLSHKQRAGLSRLWIGLRRANAKLASGRLIGSPADAVRWLFEQLGNGQLPEKPEKPEPE